MTRNTYGNVGYEPGRQCPFTPSKGASWIDSFNTKLVEMNTKSGISRNKLTELLLEQALESEITSNSVSIDCTDLSFDEKELLKSEHVQGLIKSMVKNMVAVSNEIVQTQIRSVQSNTDNQEPSIKAKESAQEIVEDVEVNYTLQATPLKDNEQESEDTKPKSNMNSAALKRMQSLRNSVK